MRIQVDRTTAGEIATSVADELDGHAPMSRRRCFLIDYQDAASSLASPAAPLHLLNPLRSATWRN